MSESTDQLDGNCVAHACEFNLSLLRFSVSVHSSARNDANCDGANCDASCGGLRNCTVEHEDANERYPAQLDYDDKQRGET